MLEYRAALFNKKKKKKKKKSLGYGPENNLFRLA